MPYSLEISEAVRQFLRNHQGLTREGRVRLFLNIDTCLRESGDVYVQDQARRLDPNSDLFWFDITFAEESDSRRLRRFRFVVDAAPAVYGVLRVIYAEEAS